MVLIGAQEGAAQLRVFGRRRPIAYFMLGLAILGSACTGVSSSPAQEMDRSVSLSGWCHTVWNAEPQYLLMDDQGRSVRLLMNVDLLRSVGGPLWLNRKRVTVVGERLPGSLQTIRVMSIQAE